MPASFDAIELESDKQVKKEGMSDAQEQEYAPSGDEEEEMPALSPVKTRGPTSTDSMESIVDAETDEELQETDKVDNSDDDEKPKRSRLKKLKKKTQKTG